MAESPLECYREVIDPSVEEWPDLPAGHYNSKRQANIETDVEYLKPHGSRPGLGYEMYASGTRSTPSRHFGTSRSKRLTKSPVMSKTRTSQTVSTTSWTAIDLAYGQPTNELYLS